MTSFLFIVFAFFVTLLTGQPWQVLYAGSWTALIALLTTILWYFANIKPRKPKPDRLKPALHTHTMKRTLTTLIFAALTFGTLHAQTNDPAPPTPTSPTSWFSTVQLWATSQNTNNLWNTHGSVAAGIDSIQNSKVNLANQLRFSYEVKGGLALEAGIRDSGVAGTLVSYQGGLSYHLKMNDLQIAPYVNGGYDRINPHKLFGEVGIRAEKKMTKFTFIGVSIGQQFPDDRRIYSAYTGFTF